MTMMSFGSVAAKLYHVLQQHPQLPLCADYNYDSVSIRRAFVCSSKVIVTGLMRNREELGVREDEWFIETVK